MDSKQAVNGSSTAKDAQLAVNTAVSTPVTQPTYAELQAMVAQLKAEKAQKSSTAVRIVLRAADTKYPSTVDGKETMVEGKGNIVAYGLGRFPISMYASQWERLLTTENVALILQLCKDPKASRKD